MQIFVVLALIILLLAVIFALQNTAAVTISFLFWKFNGSLALVLLVALTAGLLISFLAYLPTLLRSHWSARKLRKHTNELETNLAEHKQRLDEALLKLDGQSTPVSSPGAPQSPPDQPGPST